MGFRAFKTGQNFGSKLKPEKVVSRPRGVRWGGSADGFGGPNIGE